MTPDGASTNPGDHGRGVDEELRLALAMRGGVSLAVWIGGACCEIDALRGATVRTNFWTDWLRRAGYERVVVDVLAGASAGGLNGVLYAASQVYGFPYAQMREIWLRLGSTENLVRRGEPYPSLFLGDAFFQRELTTNLRLLYFLALYGGLGFDWQIGGQSDMAIAIEDKEIHGRIP